MNPATVSLQIMLGFLILFGGNFMNLLRAHAKVVFFMLLKYF